MCHIVCYMKETIIASPFDALTNDLTDRTVILFTQVDSRYRWRGFLEADLCSAHLSGIRQMFRSFSQTVDESRSLFLRSEARRKRYRL